MNNLTLRSSDANPAGKNPSPLMIVFVVAVIAFVVSFFLPVLPIMESKLLGWQAAVFSVAQIDNAPSLTSLFYAFLGLSNIVVLVSIVRLALSRPVRRILLGLLVAAAVGTWVFGVLSVVNSPSDKLYAGYYLWAASYSVIAAVAWLEARSQTS
jgi:hypothetical protein